MTIDTKFSIGDDVWLIHEGWPVCVQVTEVRVEVKPEVIYTESGEGRCVANVTRVSYLTTEVAMVVGAALAEGDLMASKEELVAWFAEAAEEAAASDEDADGEE